MPIAKIGVCSSHQLVEFGITLLDYYYSSDMKKTHNFIPYTVLSRIPLLSPKI